MTTLTNKLNWLSACSESIAWAKQFPSIETAYSACYDARWLMWLAMHTVRDKKRVMTTRALIDTLHRPIAALPLSDQDRNDAIKAVKTVLAIYVNRRDSIIGDVNNALALLVYKRNLWFSHYIESADPNGYKMAHIYDTLHHAMQSDADMDIHAVVHKIYLAHMDAMKSAVIPSRAMIPAELDRVSGLSNIVKHHIDVGDFMMGLDLVVPPRISENE